MKRIDLLRQKDNLWREIEELKKQRETKTTTEKGKEINNKIAKLKNKYDFVRLLLKANKQ